jgi:phospholipid/cholesterol/gamma-HCH transport system substrate-binding protein
MTKISNRRISSSFLVGIFVIVGVLTIVGVILWLGANQFLKEQNQFVSYFEGSVEGLDPGSPVKYQGVPIGSISKIRVAPDGRLVEVIMQIEKVLKVDDSMRVKVEMSGLAGGKFMQLYYPTDSKTLGMYPRITFRPPYPVIQSTPSGIQEIETAARDVMNNLMKLNVGDISQGTVNFLTASTKFFESENLSSIIKGIDEAIISLNKILTRADTVDIIQNLSQTSKMLSQTSNNLQKFSDNLNIQLADLNLKSHIDVAFQKYDSLMAKAEKVIDLLGYRTETALFGLNEAIEGIKTTNRQFRRSLRAITDNPGELFLSEPPKLEK